MTARKNGSQHRGKQIAAVGGSGFALGRMLARRPGMVASSTALAVALLFVSGNALWYQPHSHGGAFFQTRPDAPTFDFRAQSEPEQDNRPAATRIVLQPSSESSALPAAGDATVQRVQKVLSDLNLYTGSIDGLSGPQTREAIVSYRKIIGLEPTAEIDQSLLEHLGAANSENPKPKDATGVKPVTIVPVPTPRSAVVRGNGTRDGASMQVETTGGDHAIAVKVQAGLREFGNDAIVLDGKVGSQTIAAIREFQGLFGLRVTGQIDKELVEKMAEIGLISL